MELPETKQTASWEKGKKEDCKKRFRKTKQTGLFLSGHALQSVEKEEECFAMSLRTKRSYIPDKRRCCNELYICQKRPLIAKSKGQVRECYYENKHKS